MLRLKLIVLILISITATAISAPIYADTSSEKKEARLSLRSAPDNAEARIRLGIIIAEDVETSINMNFAAEAESALRLLDDKAIFSLDDFELKTRALSAKATVYSRLLMPAKAKRYRRLAESGTEETEESPPMVPGFGYDIEMPYYINLGLKLEDDKSILLPFTGIGLTKSAFSSMLSANVGIKYFYQGLSLNLKWTQGLTPDFSCFDYSFTEFYAQCSAAWSFSGNVLHLKTSAGRMLYTAESENFFDLKSEALTTFGVNETICLELMLFDDGLNKVSAEISSGLKQIPEIAQNSWWSVISVPFSFDFIFFELGFLPRFFYAGTLTRIQTAAGGSVNIGEKHFIYENAVILGKKSADSLFYRRYETCAAIDGVFRLFAFPLPAPADRIYIGLNGAAGFGYDGLSAKTDFLYYVGLSAGFDLNDNTPFEIRFGIDQDGCLFTYMTVVNRISHPF
ncbi:MAG: hypothetical protein JEZ04_22100 [Spirochaetales bacterium]|nr:hypothetical protein [Spirochaetales bacterium]